MRAALPSPALSPAGSAPAALRIGLALALTLVPLALFARLLFYPALEVSDAGLAACTRAGQALRAGGPGGLAFFLAGPGATARLVALLLHAGATALVFALARRLGAARGTSVLAALLFAVHPLRVEAVAWLSQGGALLGGFFFLLGAILSIRPAANAASSTSARQLLLLALLGLGSWWLSSPPASELVPDAPGFLTRLAYAPLALGALAWQWVLPLGLTPHHPHPALSGSPVAPALLAAGWLALALFVAALLRLRARWPQVAVGGLLFLLLAAPHALLTPSAALFRESAGYTALLGLELAFVFTLQALPARLARPAFALAGLAVLACAAATFARLPAWRSEPDLQQAALAVRAEPRAHDALGQWQLLHGRLGAAQREYERALELAHAAGRAPALLHLGELELRRALIPGQERHLERAAEFLEECIAAQPDWASANERLGEVYQRSGLDERALPRLEFAAEHSASARANTLLGMLRREHADPAGARAAFTRAVELDPRASDAWCGLAIVQVQQDELDGARASLARALALEPEHVEARATLARLQEQDGEHAEAEHNLRRALGVNPNSVDALYALGMLLSGAARPDEALRYLDHLCAQPRSTPHVRANLESARLRMARGEVEVPRERLHAVLAFNPEQAEARALLARLPGTER